MKQKQIFPESVLENSAAQYLHQISGKTQIIYSTLVLALFFALISLPFIYVDVSVRSQGMLQPLQERTEVKSLTSGTVKEILVKENQFVKQGDTLAILSTELLENQFRLNQKQQQEKLLAMQDLQYLIQSQGNNAVLNTSLYKQQQLYFRSQLQEFNTKKSRTEQELKVDKGLYEEGVISRRELADREDAFNNLTVQSQILKESQISQWESELRNQELALLELQSQEKQLLKEKQQFVITAPISGTIRQVKGKYKGSILQAGETFALISPEEGIIAECYVSPKDIGYLRKGMPVKLQIDAFNYNEWGLLTGVVQEIDRDVTMQEKQPFFLVKCKLEQDYLQTKKGFKGQLKKGMTLQARFVTTRRSIFQLLYDKTDKWMNPNQVK